MQKMTDSKEMFKNMNRKQRREIAKENKVSLDKIYKFTPEEAEKESKKIRGV